MNAEFKTLVETTPEPPSFVDLVFEDRGPVAQITLNRPQVTNALSIRLSNEFHAAIDFVRDVERFKILIITGAGNNFCAGDDLGEMASGAWGDANQSMRRVRMYQDMANTLEELDKITVAAVDGYCVGGGLEITMACDFVVCSDRVRWGMPEVDWGITPGWGGTTRMVRLIGRRMTKEINFLGALHKPERGVALGLFNRVVPVGELASETQRLVDLLLSKHQQGLRNLKFMINKNAEADLYTAQGFEALGAGMMTAVLGGWKVPDADDRHGWTSYASKNPSSPTRKRREAAKDFWVD